MRDLALMLGFVAMLAPVFRYPHIGALVWCWTALIVPNNFVYGFMKDVPLNKITALLTLLAWAMSRQSRALPRSSTLVLLGLLGVVGTISAFTSIASSEVNQNEWEKFVKILVFAFVIAGLITNKARIDALLGAIFLSLGFHGVWEGAKFIASAGGYHIWGPAGSILGDNNHFALGMVAFLPIVLYLYKQSQNKQVKLVFIGSSLLVLAAIMGTYSRGGLIGIAAIGIYALFNIRRKFVYLGIAAPLVLGASYFAPERWSDRMDTIANANQLDSFMGRIIAWKQSTLIALDHPLFGGGFHAVQNFEVWSYYARLFDRLAFIPTAAPNPLAAHAAHSIYFQVLGDLGFLGLLLFVAILVSSWRNASAVVDAARDRPEWRWAGDLATCLKYSLIAYVVSGAALSMAYFDFMYMICALLVVLRHLVAQPVVRHSWADKQGVQ
jgi:probable O-glycosylation ligase (exosortase A-associated)